MSHNRIAENAQAADERRFALWVYSLGLAFIVLMIVMYMKADIMLGWMERVIRALFL